MDNIKVDKYTAALKLIEILLEKGKINQAACEMCELVCFTIFVYVA